MYMTQKTVYVTMVADLFHYGHISLLKRAKEYGTKLIVGLHSDEDVAKYKRTPVLTMQERYEVIKVCKYVDNVILNAPLETTDEFMDKHNLDIYIHAHYEHENEKYRFLSKNIKRKQFIRIDYTDGISTTDIIKRIKNRNDL